MAIERVEIKDFLVFKGDFTADFCPGVNVLIGGNGTGKTTLLKAMYAATEESIDSNKPFILLPYFSTEPLKHKKTTSSKNGSSSFDIQLEYLTSSKESALNEDSSIINHIPRFSVILSNKLHISYFGDYFNSEKIYYKIIDMTWNTEKISSCFIPEKDLLSNSRKLPETVEYGDLQFNKCEIDIIKRARVASSTPEQPLYRRICNEIIDGEPYNDGEKFYIERNGVRIPYSMEASGFRKFGLLATLIRNEQIKPGSVLFWDEPENSLNPELMPKLVEILLELSRSGVQIFLATHSEFLANEFFVSSNDDDSLKYFSLYKDESGSIKADTDRRFDLLNPNRLTETSVDQYKRELDKGFDDED